MTDRELMQQALDCLVNNQVPAAAELKQALRARLAQPEPNICWCETCRPITLGDMRMVLCPTCGNKRCPHATDHRNECTGSNEPGQLGSSYGGRAQPEPVSNTYQLPEPSSITCQLPQPEPVAWSDVVSDGGLDPRNKFDTAPPRRKWQGLTRKQRLQIWGEPENFQDPMRFARAIEAKLREKNT